MVRQDLPDAVWQDGNGKFQAIIGLGGRMPQKRTAVLIGTISIEKSEYLSKLLQGGVPHNVLNAKHHERKWR